MPSRLNASVARYCPIPIYFLFLGYKRSAGQRVISFQCLEFSKICNMFVRLPSYNYFSRLRLFMPNITRTFASQELFMNLLYFVLFDIMYICQI